MSMCPTEAAVERLCAKGIIAVVRADSSEQLLDVARALLAGGVDCIEITMTTPDALRVIARCRQVFSDEALIGVGSVLNADLANAAIAVGAQYVVSPIFDPGIIEAAHGAGLPAVPGAFSPTEILAATNAGADLVKVFPATRLGPGFFRDLLAPMPHLKLTPTGGVNLDTAGDFIRAGAVTLGVGSALVDKKAIRSGDLGVIEKLAAQFVQAVAEARQPAR
jgi:2-dehydro-3-deoxyphosphogluconate aldolase/(4S)-4-hydroxy-2-oxoglutarate aldolase